MTLLKALAASVSVALPTAVLAAPVPIFESLDGLFNRGNLEIEPEDLTFEPFDADFIQFDRFVEEKEDGTFGSIGDEGRDLIVTDSETLERLLLGTTVLRQVGTTASATPGTPPTQGEFLFQIGDLSGPAADLFGSSAYLAISFDDPDSVFEDDEGFSAGVVFGVDARVFATAPAPIPVPASLPLLAGALGLGALLRRGARAP